MVSDLQIDNPFKADSQKASKILASTKRILFSIGVGGQWLFVAYIVAFYGGIVVTGQYEKVNEALGHGIIEGDFMGNLMLAVHLFLAAVITFGGPIQFFDKIRTRFPVFHRWNGRIYFVTAFMISFAGLYMNYTRGAHGGITGMMGNTLNAILIMTFSLLAWRSAMQRNFAIHKKWAIRAFLMVSGVWFLRVGYGIWILITGFTAPGTTGNLTGPFDVFLSFAHSLVPLLIIEGYFFAKSHSNPAIKKVAAGILGLLSVLLVAGIVMVAMIFWAPHF